MKRYRNRAQGFVGAKDGTTAIEYALIAGVIALMLVVAIPALAAAVGGLFNTLVAAFP